MFIAHSENKPDGTVDIAEPHASPFVVGRAMQTRGDNSMTNRFLMSVAAAALIAGTGLANAQGTGTGRDTPSTGSATQQSAPSSDSAAPSAATPMNRNDASESKGSASGMKSTQSDEKMAPGGSKSQRAQDTAPGQKSKTLSSERNETGKAGKDMKAEGRNGNTNAADSKGTADKNMNADSKSAADGKSAADSKSSTTTTGQAGAGAKLSTEQRTKISTVIKQQNIQPTTNVNFSISVGTRVPRTVGFHPLPAEVVSIHPDWRGYEMFLVGDQLVVVNPRTLEIVAVLDV
jgi:hypothetical protein